MPCMDFVELIVTPVVVEHPFSLKQHIIEVACPDIVD